MASILPDETRFQAFVQRAGDAGPIDMLALPEYQAAVPHRSAAVADSRLVETETQGGALGAPGGDGS